LALPSSDHPPLAAWRRDPRGRSPSAGGGSAQQLRDGPKGRCVC